MRFSVGSGPPGNCCRRAPAARIPRSTVAKPSSPEQLGHDRLCLRRRRQTGTARDCLPACRGLLASTAASSVLPALTTSAPAANAATTSVDVRPPRSASRKPGWTTGFVASTRMRPFQFGRPERAPGTCSPTEQPGSPARRPRLSSRLTAPACGPALLQHLRQGAGAAAVGKQQSRVLRVPDGRRGAADRPDVPMTPIFMHHLHLRSAERSSCCSHAPARPDVAHVTEERLCQRAGTVSSRAQSRCSSEPNTVQVIGIAPAWVMRSTAISCASRLTPPDASVTM